jgi:hypothetical protein
MAVVVSSAIFAIAESANVANDQTVPNTATQSFIGTVSCSGLFTHRYACGKTQTRQSCTLECVQQGSPFVLVVQNTPYLLEGNAHEIEHFAGGKAMVTGLAARGRIRVETISNAKRKDMGSQMEVSAR